MTPEADRKVLEEEAKKIKNGLILEIGTCHGTTTNRLAEASPTSEVYTVDIREKPVGLRENIKFFRGDSTTFSGGFLPKKVDLLFIDGGHGYDTVKHDFFTFGREVKVGGKIYVHDYESARNADVTRFVRDNLDVDGFKAIGKVGEMMFLYERI